MSNACRESERVIDELVDGTLDDARARAVRAHTRGCADCARKLELTEEMVAAARRLEPLDPPPAVWERVSAQLDADDRAEAARPRLWWLWQAWKRPVFLGAGFCAATALAILVLTRDPAPSDAPAPAPEAEALGPRSKVQGPESEAPMTDLYSAALTEVERADADYRKAIGELRAVVEVERARWSEPTARAFDENLAAIDAAIERQRAAVLREPANLQVVDGLHAAYRKQLDFMQEAVLRGEVVP